MVSPQEPVCDCVSCLSLKDIYGLPVPCHCWHREVEVKDVVPKLPHFPVQQRGQCDTEEEFEVAVQLGRESDRFFSVHIELKMMWMPMMIP